MRLFLYFIETDLRKWLTMNINWKLRLQNKTTLITLITTVVTFIYSILSLFELRKKTFFLFSANNFVILFRSHHVDNDIE